MAWPEWVLAAAWRGVQKPRCGGETQPPGFVIWVLVSMGARSSTAEAGRGKILHRS